jgi:hypothetical protein
MEIQRQTKVTIAFSPIKELTIQGRNTTQIHKEYTG